MSKSQKHVLTVNGDTINFFIRLRYSIYPREFPVLGLSARDPLLRFLYRYDPKESDRDFEEAYDIEVPDSVYEMMRETVEVSVQRAVEDAAKPEDPRFKESSFNAIAEAMEYAWLRDLKVVAEVFQIPFPLEVKDPRNG
jgi:hypothetical protein